MNSEKVEILFPLTQVELAALEGFDNASIIESRSASSGNVQTMFAWMNLLTGVDPIEVGRRMGSPMGTNGLTVEDYKKLPTHKEGS